MKGQNFCIINETVQQLRNFRDFITALPLNASLKLYYVNLMRQQQLRMQSELLQLDRLKLQLIAKLQQDFLNKSNFVNQSQQTILQAENKLIEKYEPIAERLPQIEEVIRMRIIIAIMSFKFNIRQGLKPKLSFEDLLIAVEQMNLWQPFTEVQSRFLKYFYLCLMWQYLNQQDVQSFMEIINLYADYLLKIIQNKQSEKKGSDNEQTNELLIDLLQCHHSFKLFKKQYNLDCLLNYQNQIYSVLYELDYSLSEQVIYYYKKLNSKPKQEIIQAVMGKLSQNIMRYDQKSVDKQYRFQEGTSKSIQGIQSAAPAIQIKRKSSKKIILPEVNKNREVDLKPINNLFVSKKLNSNLQLQRRLQLKREMQASLSKVKSSVNMKKSTKKVSNKSNNSKQMRASERQPTIVKNLVQRVDTIVRVNVEKPTYESCKKHSINKHDQLQLMICNRRSGISLKLNGNGQENCIPNRVSLERDRINTNRKRRVPTRKGSFNFKEAQAGLKRHSYLESDYNNNQIVIPSIIRSALMQYIKGFTTYFQYRQLKYKMPLYLYFQSLNKANYYYLKGEIIQFSEIYSKGLTMSVIYNKNQKQLTTVSFKLYEKDEENVHQLFMEGRKEPKLGGFYKLGGNITFYWFKINIEHSPIPRKFLVSKICYQQQIYSYNVYVTHQVSKKYYSRIIAAQQRFIKTVDQSLKIDFKYDKEIIGCSVRNKKAANQVDLRDLLHVSIQRSIHDWHTFQQIKISLKLNDKYQLFNIKRLKHHQTHKSYLFFQYSNTYRIGSYYKIFACDKILILQKFMKNVSSWQEITDKMKDKDYIVQKSWTDIILNQCLFDFKAKKYVVKKQTKGYEILISQSLIDKRLDLIKGQLGKVKWFILVNLVQFQPFYKLCQKSNKAIKSNRRRSANNSPTFLSIKSKRTVFSGKQTTDLAHVSPIKLLRRDKNVAILGRQRLSCIEYEYSWLLYVRKKIYYCFKRFKQVFTVIIKDSKFQYLQNFPLLGNHQTKQLVFSQFRRSLKFKLASKSIVYNKWGTVGVARIMKDSVIISFSQPEGRYSVQVTSIELFGFNSAKIELDHNILCNKKMLKRITEISKYKLVQKLIIRQ